MISLRKDPSGQHWLVAYYLFGAVGWFGIAARLNPHGNAHPDLAEGLWLSFWKAVVWVLPALLLVRFVFKEPVGPSLGLISGDRSVQLWRGAAVGAAFLLLTTGLQVLLNGTPPTASRPLFPELALYAVNSVIEEVPFRGFIMDRFARRYPFWRANLLQALLFLLVHWLAWFSRGAGWEIAPMSIALTTFALVLGWITRLTGSVWLAVVVHTANNFLASRLAGTG